MACGIYVIEIGDWFYIGSSVDIETRIAKHLNLAKSGNHFNPKFQNVWNKYQDFSWGILEECERENLLDVEQHFLDMNFHKENCLNINPIVNCGVPQLIPVYQWSLDGELIEVFESAARASRETGINVSSICSTRSNSNRKSAGGFVWSYENEFPGFDDEHKSRNKGEKNPMFGKPAANRTKVYQFDLLGNLINSFDSLSIAENQTGICFKSISNNIRGKSKSAGGFVWSYENEFPGLKRESGGKEKVKISQFNKDGKFIKQFDSISDAAKELSLYPGSISRCLKGSLKSTGGYIFKINLACS